MHTTINVACVQTLNKIRIRNHFSIATEMGKLLLRILLLSICALSMAQAQPEARFKCGTEGTTCRAVTDYQSPNRTTYSAIQSLFNVQHIADIFGANGLPATTSTNATVQKDQIIRIPFQCLCSNGTGLSNKLPIYTIKKDDTLYHIAAEIFNGLLRYPQLQVANNITNPTLIQPGQEVWVPLPCSCDPVNGTSVLHYAHIVISGSSVDEIAQKYGTTNDTLLSLNGMTNPKDLQAGQILDVPLKVCTSVVRNDSLDSPLLVSNNTQVYTANGCVKCNCDSANNWVLQCEPSQLKSYNWSTCPSMQCQTSLYIGNLTSDSSSCNRTTCAYAGYSNETIFTTIAAQSICPASGASRSTLQSWNWIICIHFFLFGLYLL